MVRIGDVYPSDEPEGAEGRPSVVGYVEGPQYDSVDGAV